ncbi:unnamed protein product [Cutaneotrichosporon oleaginosum]
MTTLSPPRHHDPRVKGQGSWFFPEMPQEGDPEFRGPRSSVDSAAPPPGTPRTRRNTPIPPNTLLQALDSPTSNPPAIPIIRHSQYPRLTSSSTNIRVIPPLLSTHATLPPPPRATGLCSRHQRSDALGTRATRVKQESASSESADRDSRSDCAILLFLGHHRGVSPPPVHLLPKP